MGSEYSTKKVIICQCYINGTWLFDLLVPVACPGWGHIQSFPSTDLGSCINLDVSPSITNDAAQPPFT